MPTPHAALSSRTKTHTHPTQRRLWRGLILLCTCLLLCGMGCGLEVLFFGASHSGAKKPTTRPTSTPTAQAWWKDAVFYQIFIRSFQDSGNDGIGDLKGLTQRLDYLNDGDPTTTKDLGIRGIWLLPIFQSPSYHGYDTTDYTKIHNDYGSIADLKHFLKEAHRRGIRVVVDLMINHTSNQHPWFKDSASKEDAPYRNWYVWRKENPDWKQPWGGGSVWHPLRGFFYYGIFWSGMPDLNFRHPPVPKKITQIAQHWLKAGLDGYRLDAARYILANGKDKQQSDQPETHAFWKQFRTDLKKTHPNTLLVGEVWSDLHSIAPYCQGDEFDLAFQFPLANAMALAVTSMTAKPYWRAISAKLPQACSAPFLTNHDQERIFSKFNNDANMMRLAAALLLTQPGTPFIYYGEELGLPNGPSRDDKDKRTPMPWNPSLKGGFTQGTPWHALSKHDKANVQTQTQDPTSLLSWYRNLIHLRNQQEALRTGTQTEVECKGYGCEATIAYIRSKNGQHVLVLVHLEDTSTANVKLTFPKEIQNLKSLLQHGAHKISSPSSPTKTLSVELAKQGIWLGTLQFK